MGVTAAKDYIYGRLEELRPVILSERGARQKEAKEERDFLERELGKVLDQAWGKGREAVEVDPRLADAIRKGWGPKAAGDIQEERRTVFPLPSPGTSPRGGADPDGGDPTRKERRPPYLVAAVGAGEVCEPSPVGLAVPGFSSFVHAADGAEGRA